MKTFTFEPTTHTYKLDGERLTGVTTIIGVLDKPALVSWSANCAVDYIEQNFPSDEHIFKNPFAISEVCKEARTAWAKKRDKAGDVGTQCHAWVELYAKAQINNIEYAPQYESEQVEKMVKKFIEWSEQNKVKFLLSEQVLYSEKHFYAGTVDLLIEIDSKKYIADLKTAKDIYQTNFIQMGGYHIALEELGKVKDLEGYIVINIPKELDKDGNAKIKTETVTLWAEYRNAFMHCLALYRFLNKKASSKDKAIKKAKRAK